MSNYEWDTPPLSQHTPVLNTSTIRWENGTPVNCEFGDGYYSRHNGPEESNYVFLKANRLVSRWIEFENSGHSQFSIIETGFGSGLNFFNVARAWNDYQLSHTPVRLRKLIYTSIEGYPLRRDDLQKIIDSWTEKPALSKEFMAHYPAPVKGIYQLQFDTIELNLIFMPLTQALAQFEPKGTALFNCLFLDGFAPAKNTAMWHPASLRRLSYLCKQGATFSTFTAASKVRHSLTHCGFSVTKQKGFGPKRDMLTGKMERNYCLRYKPNKPWYHYAAADTAIESPVVIIGGGVAGCATAHALARKGISSHVIEQSNQLGGTPANYNQCLYSPTFSADFNLSSQFYWHAYQHLERYLQNTVNVQHQQCGVFYIADTEMRRKYLSSAYRLLKNSQTAIKWLSACDTHNHTGIDIHHPGLFTDYGGWLNAQNLCKDLASHSRIGVQLNTSVEDLQYNQNSWCIETSYQRIKSNTVILCTGSVTKLIDPLQLCKLGKIKGQLTEMSDQSLPGPLKTVLNNGHYVIPKTNDTDRLIVGASHEKIHGDDLQPAISTDIQNLKAVKCINTNLSKLIDTQIACLSKKNTSTSNTGIRLTTRDHLPLIGPVPDMKFYQNNYPEFILSNRLKGCPDAAYLPGLFINTAHGSRGITASILSGKIISALLTGTSSPVSTRLSEAIHPARFFIRDQM